MRSPRLTAAQAAARLGVKPESLYAYVSRGLVSRERTATGSTFDPLEIEAFARRRRREPAAPAAAPSARAAPGAPLMVLDTDIAYVEDDELYFRGRAASTLLDGGLLDLAAWLFGVDTTALRPPSTADVRAARRVAASLPPAATPLDRLTVAVTGFATTDPLRDHGGPDHLARVGGRLLTGLPAALRLDEQDPNTVRDLWAALSGRAPQHGELGVLEAALVLVVDHDLAVSTFAARIAASARGTGYAVVDAALGAFATPLHGSASRGAAALLHAVMSGDSPEAALAEAITSSPGHGIPGFGHAMYRGPDDRARLLFTRLREQDAARDACAAADALTAEVRRRADTHPNIDLALAALTEAFAMPASAGAAIFAVGRIVGWIAHAIAELDERAMRLRPRGHYVGPEPI